MIIFNEPTILTVVTGFDEATDNITEETNFTFKAGEPVCAEIINDEGGKFVDLEFKQGVAFSVLRESFIVVP